MGSYALRYVLRYILQEDEEAKEKARKIKTYQAYQGNVRH